MRGRLEAIDGIAVHDIGDQQCGIVTFTVAGVDSQAVNKDDVRNAGVDREKKLNTIHELPSVPDPLPDAAAGKGPCANARSFKGG